MNIFREQPLNNVNIKIRDELNNYSFNLKNSSIHEIKMNDKNAPHTAYSKPPTQMKNAIPEFCISGATIQSSIDKFSNIDVSRIYCYK